MVRQSKLPHKTQEQGQALVEYALILVLVVLALAAALIATGPALGNVFSNTVYNLVGINGTPQDVLGRGGPPAFWATVTYVAANPPPGRAFPTRSTLPQASATPGPSPTPTDITPTRTPIPSPTRPPTATPTDHAFNAPFNDPINQPVWWRVDNTLYLGGEDWRGEYFPNQNLSGTPDRILWNQQVDPRYQYNVDFDWGSEGPINSWRVDNFSVRWTRRIYVFGSTDQTVNFSLNADDQARLRVDGTTVSGLDWGNGARNANVTLTPGNHTLVVEYAENSGNAFVTLNVTAPQRNLADDASLTAGPVDCRFTRVNGSQPNTLAWAWRESPFTGGNGFPASMRCNLELRGYVDVTSLTSPMMTFWDVWDFGSAADTSVKLQIAEYQPYNADGSGGPNWASGQTTTLRNGGKNYAWTRNQISLPSVPTKKITYRFVIESGGASSLRRWYLDDIQINNGDSGRTFTVCTSSQFTCTSYWNLDSTTQKNDFITSGRWNLTNANAASNEDGSPSTGWDASNETAGTYADFGDSQSNTDYRVHFVEFNGTLDLTSIAADGSGGQPDWEGDAGFPLLSFSQAYDLERGESIALEWTRDTLGTTPQNWQTVGTPLVSVATGGTRQAGPMRRAEVRLDSIPQWNTSPFRLRFALRVNRDHEAGGWWIDNIAIERMGGLKFSHYPFCDDAEGTSSQWLMGGQWGITNTSGAFTTGRSYTDSPSGNYVQGPATSMTLRYPIDLLNDTPEHLAQGGNLDCNDNPAGAAVRPILTFWNWRRFDANVQLHIDISRDARNGATAIAPSNNTIWSFVPAYPSSLGEQLAWERIEVDLIAGIDAVVRAKSGGSETWSTISNPAGNKYDDDFYVSIRFDTSSVTSTALDGIYIDNINIGNETEAVWKLWSPATNITAVAGAPTAGNGNGTTFQDDMDTPTDWWNRWRYGGSWWGATCDQRSGTTALHTGQDCTSTYLHDTYNAMEMNTIIDLRGVRTTDEPVLYFWNHYNIGAGDFIMVEIAAQDQNEYVNANPPRNRTGYGYLYKWGSGTSYSPASPTNQGNSYRNTGGSSWQNVWARWEFSRNDTWVREQINLSAFADNPATAGTNEGKRIRVRFVLNALDTSSNLGTGWWVDDVEVKYRAPRIFPATFSDNAQGTGNWVTEGNWGLAPDQWRGDGSVSAGLGNNPWIIYWMDCIRWITTFNLTPNPTDRNTYDCVPTGSAGTDINTFLTSASGPPRTVAGMDAWFAARPAYLQPNYYIKQPVSQVDFVMTSNVPGTSLDTWRNDLFARIFRDITVSSAGSYTILSTFNDGIRVMLDNPATPGIDYPNVINNWQGRGTSNVVTVEVGTIDNLPVGSYTIIAEWFEDQSQAILQLDIGTNTFAFSDSPNRTIGSTCVTNGADCSVPYGNSSLMLDGVINLNVPSGQTSATFNPRLEFYTLWWLRNSATSAIHVEVSTNGGFTWTQSNLTNNCPNGPRGSSWDWEFGPWCDASTYGNNDPVRMPLPSSVTGYPPEDWQYRSLDLNSYEGQFLTVRFRLQTDDATEDGWWITDIAIRS